MIAPAADNSTISTDITETKEYERLFTTCRIRANLSTREAFGSEDSDNAWAKHVEFSKAYNILKRITESSDNDLGWALQHLQHYYEHTPAGRDIETIAGKLALDLTDTYRHPREIGGNLAAMHY